MSSTTLYRKPLTSALSAICERCPHMMDDAIDIHRGLERKCCPGKCIRAFFRLMQEVGDDMPGEVSQIKDGLRERVCILAAGESNQPLETLEFAPEPTDDMETFCHRIMRTFFLDRSYALRVLRLQFCYR